MSKAKSIILAIFLFGIYSRFHLEIGPIYVPYILCAFAGISLLVLNRFRINSNTLKYFFLFCVANIFISIASVILYKLNGIVISTSLILFIYSVFWALLFLDELCSYPNYILAKYFKYTIYIVLVLCVLDLIDPFHEINLFILDNMGGHSLDRFSTDRDARYFGGVRRPFPLTREPSHVAKFVLMILPGWFLLDGKKNYSLFFILALLFLVIVRSPIIVATIGLGLLFLINDRRFKKNLGSFISIRLVVVILTVILSFMVYKLLGTRIAIFASGGDQSSIFRLIRPFLILKETVAEYPLFGVGIGNREKLALLYNDAYNIWINSILGRGYTISALLAPLAYWGIVGTVLNTVLLADYLKSRFIKVSFFLILVHYLLISLAMGAFNTVNYWAYLFIIFRIYSEPRAGLVKKGL